VDFNFCVSHRLCNFLKCGSGYDDRQISQGVKSICLISHLVRSQEASMGKLTLEETVREYNRGRKAVGEGRSRYWSEPWAYPFESNEHSEERRQAFEQGYDLSFNNTAKTRG
jgi:hypothetical protein